MISHHLSTLSKICLASVAIFCSIEATAQDRWNYRQCVDYAIEHNIELKQSILTRESSEYDLEAAKAQWFPTLDFATTQSYTNRPHPESGINNNSYNGSYGLNLGWSIYDGNVRSNNIKRSKIQNDINDLSIEEVHNNLKIEILTDYLQILYAREAIDIAKQTLEVSELQKNRAEELMKAGRLSKVDYTQFESQYHTDLYNVTSSESNYESKKMELKQLLELGIENDIDLQSVVFTDSEVLQPLPDKIDVYHTALGWLPQLKGVKLRQDVSEVDIAIAKSDGRPKLSLNGSVGTNNSSGTGVAFGDQLLYGLHEQVGVTLSIPILNQKKSKTAVAKAKVEQINAALDYEAMEKQISQNVESIYIEAKSAQAKYVSGKKQLESAELTDQLTNEQFRLGLVNTLELLTAHNNLLNARQELLQAKYLAILNIKLLDFYQNKTITL